MRRVAYCAAGTFVSFPIADADFDRWADEAGLDDDMRAPCAVLERVVARVKQGEDVAANAEEMRAACRIWQFCNHGRDDGEDVVVVDYVGDGKSVEFAPLAELACSVAGPSCACMCARGEVKMPEAALA